MKKLFKKATMFMCAMIVTIGFIGGTASTVDAASKTYGGTSTFTITIPKGLHTGTISATAFDSKTNKVLASTNSKKFTWNNVKSNGQATLTLTGKSTTNSKIDIVLYVTNENKKQITSNTKTIKVSDLGKSYKAEMSKTSGNYGIINGIKIK